MNRMIFVNPQWQGGADTATYYGAKELAEFYLHDVEYMEAPVSLDPITYPTAASGAPNDSASSRYDAQNDPTPDSQNNTVRKHTAIIGQDAILRQTQDALDLLRFAKRGKSLTIGGSCDADIAPILYLNEHFSDDLAVLWLDAHGDINTPSGSGSKLFYGMPVRTLLGESDGIFDHIITAPLTKDQIINAGGRVLDQAEMSYYSENDIPLIPFGNFSSDTSPSNSDVQHKTFDRFADAICDAVRKTGKRRLYIHLDIDVFDPSDEISTACPEPNGLPAEYIMPLMERLDREFHLTGLGIFQYKPCGRKSDILDRVIDFGLNF